jgi:DegV family protein with EDD domain
MIKIVTDSTAYLTPELVHQYDIRVIPLKVIFGKRSFRDGIDLGIGDFYRMLGQASQLPTTSQPSAGEFLEVYSELSAAGHEIISIHISSKLSGTIGSATSARYSLLETRPEAKITIIDSLSAAMGLGLIVIAAAQAATAGQTVEQITTMMERMIRDMHVIFVVNTLEYLYKGGRIGGAATLLGTLLSIKPLLCLQEGRVEPLDKVRSRRKALQRLLDIAVERVGVRPVKVAVGHGEAPEEAAILEKRVRAWLNCRELYCCEIGPVVGTYTGPGVAGLALCPDDEPD